MREDARKFEDAGAGILTPEARALLPSIWIERTLAQEEHMNIRLILSGAAAMLCAAALSSAQIAPQGGVQQRPPQPPTQQPRPTASDSPSITLAGCLYSEEAVPGRSPNIAEKAGVSEDYILADATTASDQSTPHRPGQPGAVSAGLATGRMYKVTKIDDERLKALAGKRVEITGSTKVDEDVRPGDKPANFENLPNIEGTSIREVAGAACPARPAGTSPATPAPNPNR
jgi:hypothetical protein